MSKNIANIDYSLEFKMIFVIRNIYLFFILLSITYSRSICEKTSSYEEDHRPICKTDMDINHVRKRVFDGDNAKMDSFRFATQITSVIGSCGASLITDKHVLTAAHCVFQKEKMVDCLDLNIGAYDLRTTNEWKNYLRTSKNVTVHPQFMQKKVDIAIIEFNDPVPLGINVRAITLPPQDGKLSSGTMCTVWGWGMLADCTLPEILQKANLPLKTREECQQYYEYVKPSEICAGGEGKVVCHGDSGGSLLVQFKNYYVACGIVSKGNALKNCGDPNEPTLYTDLSKYTNWIYEMTKSAGCKPRIFPKENYH